ncbi:MAG: hypothetical protein GWP09_00995, partial [Nitrospiraceae bacterium]|nr:hypothetical protein [Nitrospiraceae bacterium]
IQDTPPTAPTLTYPTDGSHITNRTPTFKWDASTDPDNDALTYEIYINEIKCTDANYCTGSDTIVENTTSLNYTPSALLQASATYEWKVKAYDGTVWGPYSPLWNFTVDPVASITLVYKNTSFGTMMPLETKNTTNNAVGSENGPLVAENNGNIYEDVFINATPIWSNASMNTNYYQFMASEYPETPNSFNTGASATTFTNMDTTQKKIYDSLNWTSNKNEAEVNLLLKVPQYEPVGTKQSIIYLRAQPK